MAWYWNEIQWKHGGSWNDPLVLMRVEWRRLWSELTTMIIWTLRNMAFHFTQILTWCVGRMRTVSLLVEVGAAVVNTQADVGDFFCCEMFYCNGGSSTCAYDLLCDCWVALIILSIFTIHTHTHIWPVGCLIRSNNSSSIFFKLLYRTTVDGYSKKRWLKNWWFLKEKLRRIFGPTKEKEGTWRIKPMKNWTI
jgi:hypothetical protein